jgi:hypothetical protein
MPRSELKQAYLQWDFLRSAAQYQFKIKSNRLTGKTFARNSLHPADCEKARQEVMFYYTSTVPDV